MSKHVTAEKHASQQSDLYHGLLNLSRFMTRIHIKINIKVNYTHTCAHHGLWWSGHLNVRTCRFRTRIHIKNKHQSDFHPYLCPSWPVQSKCQNKVFQDNNPHKNQNQSDFHHIGAHHGLLNLHDRTCLFRTKINIKVTYANISAYHGLLTEVWKHTRSERSVPVGPTCHEALGLNHENCACESQFYFFSF